MQKRKARHRQGSRRSGIAALFKARGRHRRCRVTASCCSGNRVEFTAHGRQERRADGEARRARRRAPRRSSCRAVPFDGKQIVDSWGALEFDAVPKRLGVIGAGVIGLELGSVWRRLGSEVVVLEALETFLPMADRSSQGSAEALQEARARHPPRREGHRRDKGAGGVQAQVHRRQGRADASKSTRSSSRSAAGRSRRICSATAPACSSTSAASSRSITSAGPAAANVWAVGDVVRGPMLAHKGKEEGVMVADLIAGKFAEVNYKTIPSVIYTAPEIAWVGLRPRKRSRRAARPYKIGTFPFLASGRARAMEATAGFCKIIAASDDDEILGVHIIGPMAGELIAEAVLAMEYSASTEDLQRTIHAHPTLSEALHEAALDADKIAIDFPNR